MEPFVALMRRYCIDYTSAHDLSLVDDLMGSGYTMMVSGRSLDVDTYKEAVTAAFRRYPTLALTVHDMILSGNRLAMRFSEHGAPAGATNLAVWAGISLYEWDGEKLRTCRVEQDFQGRDEQAASGVVRPLGPGHPDPWATTIDEPADTATEQALRAWIRRLADDPTAALHEPGVRLLETGTGPEILADLVVEIDDLFSARDGVAAAITMRGTYAGGLRDLDDSAMGTDGRMQATLLGRVVDGELDELHLVRDRWGLLRRLRRVGRD